MSWFANLSPDMQASLVGAAADFSGGLVAEFTGKLAAVGGARLRKSFDDPLQQTAMDRAMVEALSFALGQWDLSEDEFGHYQELFREWLLSPVVVSEFRLLLLPREGQEMDIDFMQEELEATGLSIEHIRIVF